MLVIPACTHALFQFVHVFVIRVTVHKLSIFVKKYTEKKIYIQIYYRNHILFLFIHSGASEGSASCSRIPTRIQSEPRTYCWGRPSVICWVALPWRSRHWSPAGRGWSGWCCMCGTRLRWCRRGQRACWTGRRARWTG